MSLSTRGGEAGLGLAGEVGRVWAGRVLGATEGAWTPSCKSMVLIRVCTCKSSLGSLKKEIWMPSPVKSESLRWKLDTEFLFLKLPR